MKTTFDISKIVGFDWDKGNIDKNKIKHLLEKEECQEVLLNQPLRIFDDEVHSGNEKRYGALGRTNKIRIISARDQGKDERKTYQEAERQYKKEKSR